MKAIVYASPDKKQGSGVEKPRILHEGDAVVKLLNTTFFETDLHILSDDVVAVNEGTTLGHEGIGIIEKVGPGLKNFKVGDKVFISCVTTCGSCDDCKKGFYARCPHGGWILGHLIDDTQAEYVHIPYAVGIINCSVLFTNSYSHN